MDTKIMFDKINRLYDDSKKYCDDNTLVLYGDSLKKIKKYQITVFH
jgi:hypothetical protein